MNLMTSASRWLHRQRAIHSTDQMFYARSSISVKMDATLTRTEYELEDGDGATIKMEVADFIFSEDVLKKLGDEIKIPEVGDEITMIRGNKLSVFMVSEFGGIGHWKYVDRNGANIRVHTVKI